MPLILLDALSGQLPDMSCPFSNFPEARPCKTTPTTLAMHQPRRRRPRRCSRVGCREEMIAIMLASQFDLRVRAAEARREEEGHAPPLNFESTGR
jgi:hypothetical protein